MAFQPAEPLKVKANISDIMRKLPEGKAAFRGKRISDTSSV
jgi:hypothetical protein